MPSTLLAPSPCPPPHRVVDWELALQDAQALAPEHRLLELMLRAGATPHPSHPRVIISPGARLWSVGGLALSGLMEAGLSWEKVGAMARASMGVAGSMSYLALPGGDGVAAYQKIAAQAGHVSCAHVCQVSVVVGGISCAVANEFNSQRDLVHLSRVTEARAACQKAPPMALRDPKQAELFARAMSAADEWVERALAGSDLDRADAREAAHALMPAAKATLMVVTGSLRDFQKLLSAQDDLGKEAEYREALGHVRDALASLWPELFARPSQAKAAWQQHWAKPEAFEPMLASLRLSGRDVLEFGAGTGALTSALLRSGVASVEAWEIDPELPPLIHPCVRWRCRDIELATAEDLALRDLACFPPYSLLDKVLSLADQVADVLLMVPPARLHELTQKGYRVLGSLNGEDFEPVAKGVHFVVAKGFSRPVQGAVAASSASMP